MNSVYEILPKITTIITLIVFYSVLSDYCDCLELLIDVFQLLYEFYFIVFWPGFLSCYFIYL